ncbi:MAG: hypothetical protein OXF56_13795 [Rhodobacteraceae bacterium]|nr:hypothetical protein [Paracoccaceae bacterium]
MEHVLKRWEGQVAATLPVARGWVLSWAKFRQFTLTLKPQGGGIENRIVGIGEIEGAVDRSHRLTGAPAISLA